MRQIFPPKIGKKCVSEGFMRKSTFCLRRSILYKNTRQLYVKRKKVKKKFKSGKKTVFAYTQNHINFSMAQNNIIFFTGENQTFLHRDLQRWIHVFAKKFGEENIVRLSTENTIQTIV